MHKRREVPKKLMRNDSKNCCSKKNKNGKVVTPFNTSAIQSKAKKSPKHSKH
jgi:hypothetical protein